MTSVIDAAHRSGARVVLTVQSFAWSSTGLSRQKALLGSSTARARLANQIAAAVRDRDLLPCLAQPAQDAAGVDLQLPDADGSLHDYIIVPKGT